MIDISRSLLIDGWMEPNELEWLATQAQSHSRIVELGSYCGRSTRVLAENTSGWVSPIDTWSANPLHPWSPKVNGVDLFKVFCDNMEGLVDKLHIIRADHNNTSILPEVWLDGGPEEKPDFVFIDGDHTFTGFRRDLFNYSKRIKPGGLLCGHDANNSGCRGVNQVLDDYLPGWNLVPNTLIWWVIAPEEFDLEQRSHIAGSVSFRRVS